jgi:WD40 repeat protein
VARIVCQALQRGDRITLIWSAGTDCFEPYHLAGAEREQLGRLAHEARHLLAEGLPGDPAHVEGRLADLGHQLYRTLFREGAAERGAAGEVQHWLGELTRAGQVEALDVFSDMRGRIPWELLCDRPDREAFWGRRYALGGGRRINPLRATPLLESPVQLLVIDADLADALGNDLLRPWQEAGSLLMSADGLASRLRQQSPDVMLLVGRVEEGAVRLGPDRLRLDALRGWIDEANEGNPDPVVCLLGVGLAAQAGAWQGLLASAANLLNGLVANEVPLPVSAASRLAAGFLERFLTSKQPLGEALRGLRQEQELAGLALAAFCPSTVRVSNGTNMDLPPEVAGVVQPLPATPYRPFAAYEAKDRPLFFGREDETLRLASLLDEPATRGVFLHGGAGVGKTSLVQAGLVPYLEQEGVGYRLLRDRSPLETPVAESDYPLLVLRSTGDLAGQLADALCDFCSQPFAYATPTDRSVTIDLPALLRQSLGRTAVPSTAIQESPTPPAETEPDELRGVLYEALCAEPALLGRVLEEVTRGLPFELVLAIDQGEELLTEVEKPSEVERRQAALDMLLRLAETPVRCKFLVMLRSAYLARLSGLLLGSGRAAWREFYLEEMSTQRMADALLWPTTNDLIPYTDEVPHRKYGFAFDRGLAEDIVAAACEEEGRQQYGALAWVQAAGALLYERRVLERRVAVLRQADLKGVGGTASAPAQLLDGRLRRLALPKKDQWALQTLLIKLTSRNSDGGLTSELASARTTLPALWHGTGTGPVEPIVNRAAKEGLLKIQNLFIGGQSAPYVSVAHDSVAQAALLQQEERRRAAYGRLRIIDTLWITIPLIFLAAAVTFYFMRVNAGIPREEVERLYDTAVDLTRHIDTTQMPQYKGLLAQAEQALRAGNTLHARQLLLTQPARSSFGPVMNQEPPYVFRLRPTELRGFDWHYLWKQVNNEKKRFEGHEERIEAVAVSADSQRAASASLDGTVKIWDLPRGVLLATLGKSRAADPQAGVAVHDVVFAPDGKTVATAGGDGVVRLWDVAPLKEDYVVLVKEARSLSGHQGAVRAVAYGKDATLASAGDDKTVIVWDTVKGEKKAVLKGEHEAAILALAFAPDAATLASGGAETTICLWDMKTAKKRGVLKSGLQRVEALAFDPEGKTLAGGGSERQFGTEQGMVRLWDATTGKETRPPLSHGMGVFALAYHPDGRTLASAGKDMQVRHWDVSAGTELAPWAGNLGWVRGIAFTADGATLVAGGYDRAVRVFETNQPSGPQVLHAHKDAVLALALGEGDNLLASGGRDGSVKLWETATGRSLGTLPPQNGAVTALGFIARPKQTLLAVATWDDKGKGDVKLWALQSAKQGYEAKEHKTLGGHTHGVTSLALYGERLASGDAGGTAILWDIDSGKPLQTVKAHQGEVRALAFAQQGQMLLTAGQDQAVRFWNSASGRPATGFEAPWAMAVESLASLDYADRQNDRMGTVLLTGGSDRSVGRWQLRTTDEGPPLEEAWLTLSHSQPVSAVLLQPDLLVSGSGDQTIKLWDLQGNERLTLYGQASPVRALAFARSAYVLISAGNDGKVRLWRGAPPEELRRRAAAPE